MRIYEVRSYADGITSIVSSLVILSYWLAINQPHYARTAFDVFYHLQSF